MRGDRFFADVATRPPFSKLHPAMAGFFRDYLAHEKVVRFGDKYVLNTHFPPYPSRAFERLADQFGAVGEAGPERRLFCVTWAVTNRCVCQARSVSMSAMQTCHPRSANSTDKARPRPEPAPVITTRFLGNRFIFRSFSKIPNLTR